MKLIGRYEILKEIGRGAMGIVYLGRDPKIDRRVAVKCLRPHLIEETEGANRRFQQEVLALGRLIHPHIVSIFDVGEDTAAGSEFIVMEFVEGMSLAELLKKGERLSIDQVRSIGIQICNGLDFAHAKGVVHRDIKPGNILLSPDLTTAKITDFGIARLDFGNPTQTDRLLGTPQYMSPEQCQGGAVDGRSDLFAVGALLYELLTQTKAFPGENITVVMHNVLTRNPAAPATISPEIPQRLSDAVMKAIEKDPGRRFASGKEMANALFLELPKGRPAAETGSTQVLPPAEANRRRKETARGRGRSPFLLVTAAALLSAVLGVLGWWTLDRSAPPPEAPSAPAVREGRISLSTVPDGAEVIIDGERKGISPLTLHLPAGAHELKVTKAGHHPLEATINVSADEEIPLHLKLSEEEVSP